MSNPSHDEAFSDFYYFTRYMFFKTRGYKWMQSPHQVAITNALMRVYRGETKRLIINVPPRFGKTDIAVINFIAWTLGRHPDCEFIHASYSARLAAKNSWQTRALVQHPEYQEIFKTTRLKDDSKAKDEWRTTDGGCMYSVGTGGTITGYGAGKVREGFGGSVILDDLHKADEAKSDVMRENVIDWFQNTLESRLNSPHTPIILIMQRLHEKDIAGWLLDGGNGEEWEHLCLPAINEDGTSLWEAKHTLEDLRRMEQASPYVFAGQYLQRPAPPSGGMIKPDMLQIIDVIPEGQSIQYARGWDLASSVDGDYTVGVKLGRLKDGRYIIADVTRVRATTDERDAVIKNTSTRDGRLCKVSLPQDAGGAGKSQIVYLTRELAGFSVHSSPESGSKVVRAEAIASQINVGNVLMLRGAWNDALINEMRMFPFGAHDDQIDGLSRAFDMVAKTNLSTWAKL